MWTSGRCRTALDLLFFKKIFICLKHKSMLFVLAETILCMFFSACTLVFSPELSNTQQELTILDEKAYIIIDAFETKHTKELYSILSKEALASEDKEKGFFYCCDLLDTDVIAVDRKGSPISKHMEDDKSSSRGQASFILTTESGKTYSLYFEYWYSNDFNSDLVGVNRIKLSDTSVIDENYKPGRLYERAGIYNPNWDMD